MNWLYKQGRVVVLGLGVWFVIGMLADMFWFSHWLLWVFAAGYFALVSWVTGWIAIGLHRARKWLFDLKGDRHER